MNRAADGGDSNAAGGLALMLLAGFGVPMNKDEAWRNAMQQERRKHIGLG